MVGLPFESPNDTMSKRAHYSPPWADVSIIGIAGSSGSGKSTLSHAIVRQLNLPWVVILSIVSAPRAAHTARPGLTAGRTPFTRIWTKSHIGKRTATSMTLTLQK